MQKDQEKDIRFIAVVKQSDVEYGAAAEWVIEAATSDAPDDFAEIDYQGSFFYSLQIYYC